MYLTKAFLNISFVLEPLRKLYMNQASALQRMAALLRPAPAAASVTNRELRFSPRSFAKNLLVFTALLAGCFFLFGYVFRDALDSTNSIMLFLASLFDLQSENNVPAIFSALLLLLCSGLLLFIYQTGRGAGQPHHWRLLSVILFFLALDEAFTIHESINGSAAVLIPENSGGWFGWAWVIPYAIVSLIAGIYFIPFIFQLPRRTGRLFFASGLLYVASALGLEMVESFLVSNWGWSILFKVVGDAEEILEMWGIILFIYALLDYLSPKNKQIVLRAEN